MAYWIARNNQKVGPYSLADVQSMVADGKIVSSDLAWTDGMANWGPALQVIPAPVQPPEPPAPGIEPLAPTRVIPVMRVPDVQQQPAAAQAAAQPAYQPAPAYPTPAPQAMPQPAPAPVPLVQAQPFQPAPPPAAPHYGSAPMQAGYTPQAAQPQPAPFMPPPPAAPLPAYQPYAAPPAAQPMPAQPMGFQQAGQAGANQVFGSAGQAFGPAGQAFVSAGNMAGAGAYAQGPLIPPSMHWALVLVLSFVTLDIFLIYWAFKQANFVQRLDPSNPAKKLYTIMLLLGVAYILLVVGAGVTRSETLLGIVAAGGLLVDLAAVALSLVAFFKMRASLLNYYNTVEPIGLRLSGVMTLFFNILYFQYHFSRIAQWKQTGVLTPQK